MKIIWFTGLSGSGKTTISLALRRVLSKQKPTIILDADKLRQGLCSDLGYDEKSRSENIRRIVEVVKILRDLYSDSYVLVPAITPYNSLRKLVKDELGEENVIMVYINTSLQECERRDVKGLYKKARMNTIKNFTGISSEFQEPINADVVIDTENNTISDCVKTIIEKVSDKWSYNI